MLISTAMNTGLPGTGALPFSSLTSLGFNSKKPQTEVASIAARSPLNSQRWHLTVNACQSTEDAPSRTTRLTRSSSLPELPPLLHTPGTPLGVPEAFPEASSPEETHRGETSTVLSLCGSLEPASLESYLLEQQVPERTRPKRRRSSTSALRRTAVLQGQKPPGTFPPGRNPTPGNRMVSVFWSADGEEGASDRASLQDDGMYAEDSWQRRREGARDTLAGSEAGSGSITPEEPPFETTFHEIARRLHLWGGGSSAGASGATLAQAEGAELRQGCAQAYLEQEIPCLPEVVTQSLENKDPFPPSQQGARAVQETPKKQQGPQIDTKVPLPAASRRREVKAHKGGTVPSPLPDLGVILADTPRPPPGREKHLPVPLPFYEIVVGSTNPESTYVCTATDFYDEYDWDEPDKEPAQDEASTEAAAGGDVGEDSVFPMAVGVWELHVRSAQGGASVAGSRVIPGLGLDLGELERINEAGASASASVSERSDIGQSAAVHSPRRRRGRGRVREAGFQDSLDLGAEGSVLSAQGRWGSLLRGVPFKEPPLTPSSQAFRELVLGEPHIPDPCTWGKGVSSHESDGASGAGASGEGGTGRSRSSWHRPRGSASAAVPKVSPPSQAPSEAATWHGDVSPWERILQDAEGLSRLAGAEQASESGAVGSDSDPWAQSAFCSHEAQELLDLASLSSLSFEAEGGKRGELQGMASLSLALAPPPTTEAEVDEETSGEEGEDKGMRRRRRRRKNLLRRPWLDQASSVAEAPMTSSDVETAESALSGSDVGESGSDDEAKVPVLEAELGALRTEIEEYMALHGRPLRMPTRQELRGDGPRGLDLEKWIQRLGGLHLCSARLGVPMAHGRRPRGYWQNADNIRDEIVEFQEQHALPLSDMPTRTLMEAKGRYDLARALEKWGGHAEVAAMLGLSVKVERPKGLTFKGLKVGRKKVRRRETSPGEGVQGRRMPDAAPGGERGDSSREMEKSGEQGSGDDSDCPGAKTGSGEGKGKKGSKGRPVKGPMKALLPSRTKKWFTLQLNGPPRTGEGKLQTSASET